MTDQPVLARLLTLALPLLLILSPVGAVGAAPSLSQRLVREISSRKSGSYPDIFASWSRQHGSKAIAPLLDIAENPRFEEKTRSIALLGAAELAGVRAGAGVRPRLSRLLLDRSWLIRLSAIKGLDVIGPSDSVNTIAERLRDPALVVRAEAADSLLHLAGELDVSLGGPSIAINDEASKRRSLYFVHSHNDHQKFLSTFDDASVLDCYRRAESIVPQQALALENSPLATAMSGKIAQRIAAARPNASDSDFIRFAFVTILSVEPTSEELITTTELLQRMADLARSKNRPNPEAVARTNLVQTLLNHNDFITIR